MTKGKTKVIKGAGLWGKGNWFEIHQVAFMRGYIKGFKAWGMGRGESGLEADEVSMPTVTGLKYQKGM